MQTSTSRDPERTAAFTPVRVHGQQPGYEIWFAVFIEPELKLGLWLRHTYLRTHAGQTQVHLWASFFNSDSQEFMPALGATAQSVYEFTADRIRFQSASMGPDSLEGQCLTTQGPLHWQLELHHRFAPETHSKGGLLEKLAGVHSTVLSPFATASGEVQLGKKKFRSQNWQAVMMHIHGWRRVDTLHWLWAPALETVQGQTTDFGLEAISVRARSFLPPLTLLTLRNGNQILHAENLGGNRRHRYPDLEFKGKVGNSDLHLRGRLNTELKTGYIYLDPDQSRRFIAQSVISHAECILRQGDQNWHLKASRCSAIEFHGRKAWPDVMYLDPYEDLTRTD